MASWEMWKSRWCAALVLGVAAVPAAMADPVFSVTSSATVIQGTSFAAQVGVGNAVDLFGYQFSLSFNPAVLQAVSVTEGSFLGTGGTTFFGAGTINNTAGTISFVFDTLIGSVPGVSGAGALASVTFAAAGVGTSALTLSDVIAQDSNLAVLTVTTQAGSITVSPVPEPAAWALFGAGLAGVALARRRREHSAA